MLIESARLARGNVKSLTELKAKNYDTLILPGGFGIAKNLSDYGIVGKDMVVDPQIEKILKEFHGQNKWIAASCIAPILISKVLGNVSVTFGDKGEKWLVSFYKVHSINYKNKKK